MKKFCFSPLFLLTLLFPTYIFSQHEVKGNLQDKESAPVAFANVVLFETDSVTVYRGAVSNEEGEFVFENIAPNDYVLAVSFIGFERYVTRVNVTENTTIPTLILNEDAGELGEVTINGRNPTVTKTIDRMVFNVENTTLSTGSTYELLKRTPGVIESQGQLLVKNRPATVYINDRRVYLTQQELQQLLEGFSGANIKSVEVITNPPAKYDAEGGAILNIKTSKNISVGYKGSLNASNTVAVVPKYLLGTSQYYKNDWVNVFASYNFNSRFDYKNDEGFIEFYEPGGGVDSRWFNDFEKDSRRISHNLNTIIDFTLSERSSLSLSANLQLTPKSDSDIRGLTQIYNPQGQLDSLFTTRSDLRNEQDNILLSATYTTEVGENGGSLSAVANYLKYDDEQLQDLLTRYSSPGGDLLNRNSFSTISGQNTDIYTGKIDYSTPVAGSSLETGVKYSGIRSQSGMDFFDTNAGGGFVEEFSDHFDYDEDIYAAYLSWSKEWDAWSIKGGLRGEYTDVTGNSISMGLVNTQEYFELFPTFYLMHSPGEDHSFGLDYSRRIGRPRFQSLNPYRYFINENNFQEGNPNLRPSIANRINFNYTYKNKLSFDLYWDKADNAMATLPFQDNENRQLRSVYANMDFSEQFSLDIMYYDYVTEWWYLYAYASMFYMQNDFVALESGNQVVTNDIYTAYIQAQNFLTLSKDGTFSAEVTGSFLPGYIEGSYNFDEPQTILSVGLRKSFLNDRLVATINVDDIFNGQNIPLVSNYLNQNNSYFVREGETRRVRFGVIYKFGNFKLRDNSRAIEAEEGKRLGSN
ncbi:TonB-dependent receptor [Antarcticibacterium flavum]|uniref:TonB-dependent receptor n=1 Tax=Antarcticibacterium flavum TaxID=2058175 RepID=A0A5B7X2Z4_9FLAO|nr:MULTISPECIES: outer membrane beta-barrel family protein [Antarcticibacterium]MCM4160106.1 TonB-dependent receptor [Antarcticibacterium sp. W02-3]QCY69660.1 TonB-dependent receptor [Antarcticibacterium flavum]